MLNAQTRSPPFPPITWINGRGYMPRSVLERHKADLIACAQGIAPVEPAPISPDPLVPLRQICVELGVGRRTIGRRIAEAQKAAVANAAA